MLQTRVPFQRRSILAALVATATMSVLLVGFEVRPAAAAFTAVKGSACAYYTKVGLFGGPQAVRGCGQPVGAPASAASPFVNLPQPAGSPVALIADDPDGAAGVYTPATIFGGRWPAHLASAPPSGPLSARTQGASSGTSVTSSASILLDTLGIHNVPADDGVGGFGPGPVEGDELRASCTATASSVTGTTTVSNTTVWTTTDANGEPLTTVPIPPSPPINHTVSGVLSNVGDVFTVVFNEQIKNADGSITVNGFHMYMFGPTAIGESVGAQVKCGTTPSPLVSTDTTKPNCGPIRVLPVNQDDPTPRVPRTELIGVFDAGKGAAPTGLQSISNVVVTNGTVQLGNPNKYTAEQYAPNPIPAYLLFVQGQITPLPVIATRINESLPMSWSFTATDASGNTVRCGTRASTTDFDNNRTSDRSVYRDGAWYAHNQAPGFFGLAGYIPVPGDYDGNLSTDKAVFKDGSWFVDGQATVNFGAVGDVPVPADYDGNGTTDRAVYRPSGGVWYIHGQPGAFLGGGPNDIPVPGDYDGDRAAEPAIYRDGGWFVDGLPTEYHGLPGYIPVPGDYDGNGTTDRAVFKDGGWFVQSQPTVFFGLPGHIPQPADFNGDGVTDRAVYDQGAWYTHNQPTVFFGLGTDIPLPLPYAIRSRIT